VTRLGEALKKVARPPDEIRAENLRRWIGSMPGVTPLAEAEARQRSKLAGVIQNIRIDPREGRNLIEATIIDGSGGELVVRLIGRTTLAGWRLGEGLIVEGTVAEKDGVRTMLNPEWDLVAGPEHG
jgi:hypothetical protein